MRPLLIFLISLTFVSEAICQSIGQPADTDSTPKFSNEFLSIGVGAQALGMSNAFTASANNVYAGYWNPAGLLKLESLEAGLMHSEYFAGIAKYDYLGVAKPIDENSSAGFSLIRFGVDDIPNTTQLIDAQGNLDYNRITSFSAVDYAFIFSYARKLKKTGFSFGANAKLISRRIGDFANAFGFGLDASLNYEHKNWNFSAVGRDITSTINSWSVELTDSVEQIFSSTGNDIPGQSLEITLPRIILGANRHTVISEKLELDSEIDLLITTDGQRNTLISADPISIAPVFGFNLGYKKTLFIRGGVGNFQEVTRLQEITPETENPLEENFTNSWTFQPNFGIGLKLKKLNIDYALTDIGNASDVLYSNVFSISMKIN